MSSPVIHKLRTCNQFLKVFKNNLTKVCLSAGKQERIFCVHCMKYATKNKLIEKCCEVKALNYFYVHLLNVRAQYIKTISAFSCPLLNF